ncbi:Acyl-(acyl-carrier-protein)/UDP-N- acetylglucosamine O-acyltransferase [Elusimicrobium minutum Pei191]|uniref:Acyl-(Acyl-carrier-protein)/UDP-N-acetylglucosamine O-acyltransferase n=1 Tax=Elusimicrobium minutum (strain Pei191) TaxID=445932 RepID=B2KAU9_ELUMP|nr:acyl-ACP--UDP-N-acetylglucosamine O-acyltransferase [Elusimicrobium minutum]ACC97645.1 Acyl-(acyl-carrier-protein)/UDP-N- acetylglucosamine O-acyltransferase [Elusimicrobium minutum Pei191]
MSLKIHPSAVVDKSAVLEDNVEIGPFVVIGANVKIGSGSYVGPHCVVENCVMGKNNELVAGCYVGIKPQDLSYKGIPSMVVMGDGNKIREAATIHRSSSVETPTKIGSNCLFMAGSHVAHDCEVGNGVIIANVTGIAGHCIIEDKAIISGLVGAHQFCRIGTMCMVSGASGVHKDIAPYCIAQGYRAGLVGLNVIGLRRNGFSRETIKSIKDTYKNLFLSGLIFSEAVEKAAAEASTPEAKHMVDFCRNSKRGMAIARMKMTGDEIE